MKNDVLAASVEYAFNHSLDSKWLEVMKLIQKLTGGNKLVERCRGDLNLKMCQH